MRFKPIMTANEKSSKLQADDAHDALEALEAEEAELQKKQLVLNSLEESKSGPGRC